MLPVPKTAPGLTMHVLMHILTFVWNSNLRRTGHQTCQLHIITQTVNLFYSPQIHSSIMLSLHIANNSTPYIWILSHQDLRRHERARHTAYDRLQITKCIFTQIFHAFSSLCVKILWHTSSFNCVIIMLSCQIFMLTCQILCWLDIYSFIRKLILKMSSCPVSAIR